MSHIDVRPSDDIPKAHTVTATEVRKARAAVLYRTDELGWPQKQTYDLLDALGVLPHAGEESCR